MNKSTIGRIVNATGAWLSAHTPSLGGWVLQTLFRWPMPRRVTDRERAIMASAKRSSVSIAPGRTIPVYAWGDGPTVLLVHGWSSRASQLTPLVAPLLDRGHRVVAFDAPAHGEASGSLSAVPEFARAVEAVAADVGPLHGIVAHSLGAAATTLALSVGVRTDRVVYLAPPEDLSAFLNRLARRLGMSEEVALRARSSLERRYGVRVEDMRGAVLAPALRTPLLVFHDEADREVPIDDARRLVEHWPAARLVSTRGLGHNRIVGSSAVVDASLAFLTDPLPSGLAQAS